MKKSEPKKRILVCPLDWGMGHATRCIPIVKELLTIDTIEIVFAGEKSTLEILSNEFPLVKTFLIRGYRIKYYKNISVSFSLFLQAPKIIFAIIHEHFWLKKFIKNQSINLVISDNRFGLYSRYVPTIFITHQVFIIAPIFGKIINKINHWFINKFTQCWIPDFEGVENLSGKLSHGKNLPSNCIYIDPLSRLYKSNLDVSPKFDIAAIVSGPEQERTKFENNLLKFFKNSEKQIVFFRGVADDKMQLKQSNIKFYNNCSTNEMNKILLESEIIISKSGYSTVMDLHGLEKKAILFPTKGQSEQEYLAHYLSEKKQFFLASFNNNTLEDALLSAQNFKPIKKISRKIVTALVKEILEKKVKRIIYK